MKIYNKMNRDYTRVYCDVDPQSGVVWAMYTGPGYMASAAVDVPLSGVYPGSEEEMCRYIIAKAEDILIETGAAEKSEGFLFIKKEETYE